MIKSAIAMRRIKDLICDLEKRVLQHEKREITLFEPAYQEYKNDLTILKKFWELEGEK